VLDGELVRSIHGEVVRYVHRYVARLSKVD